MLTVPSTRLEEVLDDVISKKENFRKFHLGGRSGLQSVGGRFHQRKRNCNDRNVTAKVDKRKRGLRKMLDNKSDGK